MAFTAKWSRRGLLGLGGCIAWSAPEPAKTMQGKPVFVFGTGPAVLFLHEIQGLQKEALDFGRRLSTEPGGFRVYMPLLFGRAEDGGTLRALLRTACWGRQFDCSSNTSLGTITSWAAGLVAEIDAENGGRGVAVIGNCLTGAVPLALLANPSARAHVRCCVVAQPALPLGLFGTPRSETGKRAMGLTEDELREASAARKPVLAMRMEHDPVVPEVRMTELRDRFPREYFEYCPVKQDAECHHHRRHTIGHRHASLTDAFCDEPGSHGLAAYRRVVGFLDRHMRS